MRVEAAELREEDLALHVYSREWIDAGFDQECDLFELPAQSGIRKDRREGWVNAAQCIVGLNGARARVACSLHELEVVVERSQLIERNESRRLFARSTRHAEL